MFHRFLPRVVFLSKILLLPLAFFVLATLPLFAGAVVPLEGTYTLVALPDTQLYAQNYPSIYNAQTQWIVDNKDSHNIQYAMQLGDITNRNTVTQWNNAKAAVNLLDGEVPYALSLGNHDYGTNGKADSRFTYFNETRYFGRSSSYAQQSTTIGFFEPGRTDNSYHLFSMGDQDWMILSLEFGPRDSILDWAKQVVENHSDRQVLIITHSYMYNQDVRNDHILVGEGNQGSPYKYGVADLEGGVNDGQDMWEKLVANHSNIFMVLSGHIGGDGTGYRETLRKDGTVVHEMLIDYQMDENGGNGFMRLFEFLPDGSTVNVKSYSPYLDAYDTEPDQDFTIAVFDRPIERDSTKAVLNDAPTLFYELQKQNAKSPITNLGSTKTANNGTYTGSGETPSEFDGDSLSQINVGSLDQMQQWSITAWVRPDKVDSRQTILSNDRNGANDDVLFGLAPDGDNNATTIGHWAISHQDQQTGKATIVEAATEAVAGQWYHLGATCNGETIRLYVDGNLAGETTASGNDLDWGAAMAQIGKSFNSADNGRPFNGTIGEVALYDSVLSTSDVKTQRLAMFNRVAAGNLVAHGATRPSENIVESVSFPQQSMPGFTATDQSNRGDFAIAIGGRTAYAREGVLLATVSQNGRDGYYGSVEATTSSSGVLNIVSSAAGPAGSPEININSAVAWFPFQAGWKGGHVLADGSFPAAGYDMEDTKIAKLGTGQYWVYMPVNSVNDGMLFTIGANNSNLTTSANIHRSGRGWYVDVQNNNGNDLHADANFSFLYIPYDSENLIGGQYDGYLDEHERSVGQFTMTRLTSGRYQLAIEGESSTSGMLLLETLNDLERENSLLSYEADDEGNFIIESRSLVDLTLDDTQFYWTFVSFNDPLSLPGQTKTQPLIPGDANGDDVVDGSDVTILAGNWQHGVNGTANATWAMGDFNGDGKVDGSDVTILAGNWQSSVNTSATSVPEPAAITLLAILALPHVHCLRGCVRRLAGVRISTLNRRVKPSAKTEVG